MEYLKAIFTLNVAANDEQAAKDLLADLPLWVEKTTPKGTIVLSGFYQTDTPILVEAAKTLGLALTSQKELDGWACLTFGKQ